MTLTEIIGNAGFGYGTDDAVTIKKAFTDWLAEVGLPGYKSIDLKGNEFDVTESLRKLLILLVDEP